MAMSKKDKEKKKETAPKGKLLNNLLFGPWKSESQPMTREEWLATLAGDIDPLKHAGEAWFETEEYAKPSDIADPFVRAQVGAEGDYYPETYRRKKR
jgi:hypothetical protein